MAVTDHGNMFGTIDFYKKAKDAGIKPIIGIEAYVAGPKGRGDRTEKIANHLILLAKNEEGYANLRYLASTGYLDGFYYHPRIDKQVLKEHSQGPHRPHRLPRRRGHQRLLPRRHGPRQARRARVQATSSSPGSFFLEIQSNGMEEQEKANDNLKQLSQGRRRAAGRHRRRPLHQAGGRARPRAADVHRLGQDAGRQQAHAALHRQALRHQPGGDARLLRRHAPRPSTTPCASPDLCNVELSLGKPMLPTFKVPDSHTRRQLPAPSSPRKGLAASASTSCPTRSTARSTSHRLELRGWRSSRRWASRATSSSSRTSSTGRSSTASPWGRAAARAPARSSPTRCASPTSTRFPYNLLFERFLNPERVSMPDFDVDFCQDRRDEVIHYVAEQVRPGQRRPDHHLRLAQGEERAARRLPRVRPAVLRGRPHRQAGARRARHHLEAGDLRRHREGHRRRASLQGDDREARQGGARSRARRSPPRTCSRSAWRSRASTARPACTPAGVVIADKPLWEFVPVYQPPGETHAGHPVRQGRGGGRRPGEVRLPRA